MHPDSGLCISGQRASPAALLASHRLELVEVGGDRGVLGALSVVLRYCDVCSGALLRVVT